MGLFTKNGELPRNVIKILEEEKSYRSKDTRNKQFRVPRELMEASSNCENLYKAESKQSGSSSSSTSSDIKSDGDLESVDSTTSSINKENMRAKSGGSKEQCNFRSPLLARNLNNIRPMQYQ